MIEAHRVSKLYGRGVYALRDLSLRVDKGEFVFLTGPSGAGKSTLLRLLLRQDVPSEGDLVVGGRSLAALTPGQVQSYRRSLGFVFQDFKLLPTKTVIENVALVPRVLGVPISQQQRRVFQVLKWVGLQHRMTAYPQELSGGEQQRIAIARALVNDPVIILADEPTGNLDPDLSLEIMNLLREVNARGTTVLVATHDRELIRRVGRRALDARPRPDRGGELMRALKYFVSEAAASLWRGRRSAILAILTIGAGLFVLGFFLIVNTNVRRLTERWGESAEFAVYLRDDITPPQLESVQSLIDGSGLSAGRQYVSKAQAAERFGRDFPGSRCDRRATLPQSVSRLGRRAAPAGSANRRGGGRCAGEDAVVAARGHRCPIRPPMADPAQRRDYFRAVDRPGHRGAARAGVGADRRQCRAAGGACAP